MLRGFIDLLLNEIEKMPADNLILRHLEEACCYLVSEDNSLPGVDEQPPHLRVHEGLLCKLGCNKRFMSSSRNIFVLFLSGVSEVFFDLTLPFA